MTTEYYCPAQDGDPCHNDDCPRCRKREAYWRREWERYGRREYEQQLTYAQDMIDAGRGHLLREDER